MTAISVKVDLFLFWIDLLKNSIAAIVIDLLAFYALSPAQKHVLHPNAVMINTAGNVVDSVLPVTFPTHH